MMEMLKDVVRGVGTYTVLALALLTAVNVAILIWSLFVVIPQIGGLHTQLYLITPWLVVFADLGGLAFAAYYVLIVAAIVLSCAHLVRRSYRTFPRELLMKPLPEGHSPLYVVGTIMLAMLSFNSIYYLILGAVGFTPTGPDYASQEDWKVLYSLARASVWEEIISRVLLIGVPLLLFHLALRRREGIARYFAGGGFKVGSLESALVLFSSGMFSAAHLFNWDVSKIPPTFIAGLAFGFLFLKFGLYIAIVLHFAWDYLSVPIYVFPSIATVLVIGLLMLVWTAIGSVFFVSYFSKLMGFLLGRRIWPDSIESPAPDSIPSRDSMLAPGDTDGMGVGFEFGCQYCGNTEARYRDGRFECTLCGRRL